MLILKSFRYFTVVTITILSLASCGTQKLQQDLDSAQQSINDLRSYQAEQATQVEALKNEIRSITGRLDILEHNNSNSDLNSLKDDLSNLKRRVPPPTGVPVDILEQDEVLASTLPEEVNKLFSDGLQKIREGRFEYVTPVLRNALDLSYDKDWSANLLFWLGISYELQGDNRNALASYNEVSVRYSKHPRASATLFRQSELFIKMGDKSTARLSFKKLMSDYPKSKEALFAKEKLKNL